MELTCTCGAGAWEVTRVIFDSFEPGKTSAHVTEAYDWFVILPGSCGITREQSRQAVLIFARTSSTQIGPCFFDSRKVSVTFLFPFARARVVSQLFCSPKLQRLPDQDSFVCRCNSAPVRGAGQATKAAEKMRRSASDTRRTPAPRQVSGGMLRPVPDGHGHQRPEGEASARCNRRVRRASPIRPVLW